MSKTKKITTNVNKDAGLMDMPSVSVSTSKWISKHANYISCNVGDIVPVYVSEVVPKERRKVTMAMLSHMTTPQAPLLNALYTEYRAFFVPHRLSADLLGGYDSRRSPWVKVFGEDDSSTSAEIIVPLANQKLPDVSSQRAGGLASVSLNAFGGILDALDYEPVSTLTGDDRATWFKSLNFLSLAAYELIYQYCYRNQNRESSTASTNYKWLYNLYSSTSNRSFEDKFHVANREKDYFTGSQPFTQKGDPVNVSLGNAAKLKVGTEYELGANDKLFDKVGVINTTTDTTVANRIVSTNITQPNEYKSSTTLYADLSSVSGINIEQLRILIKTQEMLEKDMMFGTKYIEQLNAHFSVKINEGLVQEPQEIRKLIVTSQQQAVLQTSTTSGEPTILGSIGANCTTQSGELEIVPEMFFPEYGYLIICAVHKTQNVYDALYFKPKHIFKSARFDWFTPEIEDLGFQKVDGAEMNFGVNGRNAVSFNESFAEYRYVFNKCHGMLEPARSNALDYWSTAMSNYNDIQSMYKQGTAELDRSISVTSEVAPQFFDAYGFIEVNEKPMKLHSIPGMDGVI